MVEGEIDPDTGYVLDVVELKRIVETEVLSQLDHRNLNLDVDWFRSHIPSAENIAVFVWERLRDKLPSGNLKRVRLWETPRNWVDYDGT